MSSQPAPQPKIVFDAFEFSPASGELRKHGRVVRLQGQPIQILETLLIEAGQVVTRESLQQRLWSGAVSGDFEHGLNAAVNKLRQALGDSAEEPRFIETIPGKGYRFIANTIQAARPVLEMKPPAPAAIPHRRPIASWVVPSVAAFVLIVGALGYWLGSRQDTGPIRTLVQFTIAPPPGFFLEGGGNRQSMAVSHDGSAVAYTAKDSSGRFRIFTRSVAELESREVPDSAGAGTLFWLPDGSLVYAAVGKLRRLERGAKASRIISEVTPNSTSGILISPDRLLLTNRFHSAILPANGGPNELQKANHNWPQLLPGGQYLLHALFDPAAGWKIRASLFEDPTPPREILVAGSRAIYTESPRSGQGYLLFARGGALLAQPFDASALKTTGGARMIVPQLYSFLPVGSADFSISARGELLVYQRVVHRSQLIWVDRKGNRLRAAGPDRISTRDARLSPDGKRFASALFDVERGVTDIWITDTASGQSRRQIAGPGLTNAPVWSPDSKRLAFMRAFESTPKLFVKSIEGKETEQSLAGDGFQLPTDWTRDGRFILYNDTGQSLVENEGQGDIWAADLANGGKRSPLIKTPFHESSASVSPDGQWVAFMSTESKRPEVYLQRLDIGDTLQIAGPRLLISQQGAVCLRWRRDGKELFYLGGNGSVYAVPVNLQAAQPVTGKPERLFGIEAGAAAAVHSLMGFDVAADGQSFVVPSVSASVEPSTLAAIQNWEELLTPALPAAVPSSRP